MDEHTIKDKQGKRVATVRSGPDVWEQMRKEYEQHAQELKKCFKPGSVDLAIAFDPDYVAKQLQFVDAEYTIKVFCNQEVANVVNNKDVPPAVTFQFFNKKGYSFCICVPKQGGIPETDYAGERYTFTELENSIVYLIINAANHGIFCLMRDLAFGEHHIAGIDSMKIYRLLD